MLQKPDILDGLQRPCYAFVTFESEEGVNRAKDLNNQCKGIKNDEKDPDVPESFDDLLGGKMILEPSPEPSDIIWENRFYTDTTRMWKNCVKWLITIVFLLLVAAVIFWMQKTSIHLNQLWPETDCVVETDDFMGE